jgi:hypothetical protein
MDHRAVKAMAQAIVPIVRDYTDDVVAKAMQPLFARMAALEARPVEKGEKGEKGDAGERGPQGEPGLPGAKGDGGPAGMDGRDGQPGIPGRDGKDGLNGLNGKDGIGPEDIEEELQEDGRFLVRRYLRDGVIVKEFRHKTNNLIDRGVWRPGNYLKGDTVSFGGSAFFAQEDTSDKPETSRAWRLSVKHGRNGRDGEPSRPVEPKMVVLK